MEIDSLWSLYPHKTETKLFFFFNQKSEDEIKDSVCVRNNMVRIKSSRFLPTWL